MRKPLRERARGRWHGILPMLGVSKKYLTGKHGPCPVCGGKDRFRFDDKDGAGTFFCNHCGAGDGVSLVMLFKGVDFKAAALMIEAHIGEVPMQKPKPARSEEKRRAAIRALGREAKRPKPEDPVERYLRRRCGTIPMPSDLFYTESCKYSGTVDSWHPAMLAVIRDQSGGLVNVQRHYLTYDGHKADVAAPVKVMPGDIPAGSAVELVNFNLLPAPAETMGVAEGVITALSAQKLFKVPVWAVLSDGLMKQWRPPAGIKKVMIFADNDPNYAGEKAAYLLAWELVNLGYEIDVRAPDDPFGDWNDVLMDRMAEGLES